METTTDILNELTSLSPLIAGMKKVNVFTVPPGYFDSVSITVLACLQEDYQVLNPADNEQSPDVPQGYFDHLADSIIEKIKAREADVSEIRQLSPSLFAIQHKNVFEVPTGYFETLSEVIFNKIKTVTAKEELKEISPLLYKIQNESVFDVPAEYFDNLPENILRKVQPLPAKVISMRNRSLVIKYAVAAMLTGVIALGLYKYLDKAGSIVTNDATVATLDADIEKGKNMNEIQFSEVLEDLTEADIAQYLEKNGDIADVAILRSNLEEINLPSQEDYLQDETTLENYLNEIEKITVNN